jgi:four helix bundle protein
MGKSILKDRSYFFAIEIVKVCRLLQEQREYVVSRQLLRSGTAIGALIREAEFAESRADFAHKMKVALKEANETDYWLLLLTDTCNESCKFKDLQATCKELIAMLVATVKKTKSNM